MKSVWHRKVLESFTDIKAYKHEKRQEIQTKILYKMYINRDPEKQRHEAKERQKQKNAEK